ncbi:MAG: hypothetical protein WD645_03195, partial [Dehalococcoidia bacterium]
MGTAAAIRMRRGHEEWRLGAYGELEGERSASVAASVAGVGAGAGWPSASNRARNSWTIPANV